MRLEINVQTMAVVALLDPVAVRNIWIIGYLVGLCRASVISPIPNKIAIEKATVMTPLSMSAITMLRGTTTAESVTSSPVRKLLADMLSKDHTFKDACSLIWLVPSIPKYVSPREIIGSHVLQILTNETPRS